MDTREDKSVSIPNDLIVDIFSRLPAKSVARFRCVSKRWDSMFHRPYFTELFLTRSWSRPRLLLVVLTSPGEYSVYSSLQPHNPYHKSSPLVIANSSFHMKFPQYMQPCFCGHASGLIYFSKMRISNKSDEDTVPFICNPRTGQYVSLPRMEEYMPCNVLGFDPIEKQFKVVSIDSIPNAAGEYHRILTLGTGEMRWRKIQCPFIRNYVSQGISIDGVLYYPAIQKEIYVIVCFDVRSEKFRLKPINEESIFDDFHKLVNYKDKLGVIWWNRRVLRIWVLEDVEKQEWSKYVYTFAKNAPVYRNNVSIAGVTATGEIVLSERHASERFDVFYFNPDRNTLQCVEIQGLEKRGQVYTYVDHIEDLNINDAKYLKSSPRLNVIRTRPNH